MKQLIVMIAMVVLGIALAVMILGFKTPAQSIVDSATTQIVDTVSTSGK